MIFIDTAEIKRERNRTGHNDSCNSVVIVLVETMPIITELS